MARETRLAIVGAGHMARVRGKAFLETGRVRVCAVASRRGDTAGACAAELGCTAHTDDYRRLSEWRPDAVLIEVPHNVQDQVALWGLDAGYHLLVGGALASNHATGQQIAELAERRKCVVEAGYQRRYEPAWEEIRDLIHGGSLGDPVMAVCMALWSPDPTGWYYDQEASGGMPLTHMSYCYLNAIRWILGTPVAVSACANRKVETAPGRVLVESCGALVGFEHGAFASATASYAGPSGISDAETRLVCTKGGVQVHTESDPGTASFTVFRAGAASVRRVSNVPSPFVRQANAFLDAIETGSGVRNPAGDALVDCQIAEAISLSARDRRVVHLAQP